MASKKLAKRTEASISVPLPKGQKIEVRFQRGQIVHSEKIKKGETKIFFLNGGCLIVHHIGEKIRAAFIDKTGKIKDMTEI